MTTAEQPRSDGTPAAADGPPAAAGDDTDIGPVADRLYGLPLDRFTAERNALARTTRTADRALAARIAALPKPSAAARLVNELVREGRDDLHRVLELGAALRRAQQDGDRRLLRDLTGQRRLLLAEVLERSADRAGTRPSAAVLEELQQTLLAVIGSTAAATAVSTGHLIRALRPDGLDPVDLSDAVALPDRLPPEVERPSSDPARPRTSGRPSGQDATAEPEPVLAAALADAERLAGERGRRAEALRQEAAAAAEQARAASARLAERSREGDELRTRLDGLRRRVRAAEQAVAAAEQASDLARSTAADTERAAGAAQHEAEQAAAALRDLRSR